MGHQRISSIKDPLVVEARELVSAAGRRRLNKCLLEGAGVIEWALAAGIPVERVFFDAKLEDTPLLEKLVQQGVACLAVSDGLLKKISDTSYAIPFIGVTGPLPNVETSVPRGDFVCVLDDVRDHGNIGTIVRTARAFGIDEILSTRPDLDLCYRKIVEASRGGVFAARLWRFDSAAEVIRLLRRNGYQIVATSSHARSIQSLAELRPQPVALVIGNESTGVSEEMLQAADVVVQIPMHPQVESLNVGVATGISIYELKIKLVLAMLTKYIRATLGRNVNVAGKLVQMVLDARLRAVSPLTGTQAILLMVLKCDQEMTIEQIGKDTATSGAELDQLLGGLLDEGYVARIPVVDGQRVVLTDKGERAIGQLWAVVESTETEILSGFSGVERTQLVEYLDRVQQSCIRLLDAG